ncbi:uncharacterized protein [Lolium perenne]|uniref:uncharacterized protein n=1 Tax=Lolium perenne TaxID=4522 RepID=UPI0021F68294|nr:31 kDa ribonucleoprotein, chloroplastic-like [Lolium perenne]
MGLPRGGDQLAKRFAATVVIHDSPPPRGKMKGKSAGVPVGKDDEDDDDDDCVILDGDPHRPVAVSGAGYGGGSDEVEIVAVRGEIACKDFPHSRHVCSEFPFGTTSHVKHCSMCYCFVCDALAPCKYWGKGVSNNDHCHATDKEAKWKTQRQAFKSKILPATYPEKHQNVVYPSTPSPRRQDYYNDYTSEEYRVEDEEEYLDQDKEEYSDQDKEEYSDQDEETTVCVGNLPYGIDSQYLGQLFWYAGVVVFSEVIYDRETGLSCGYGYVTMSTVQEADDVVKNYHLRELYGRLVTVSKAAASASPRGAEAEETPSPCPSTSSLFKLYVANLPWDVDGSELKQLFSEYGEVVHAKVLYKGRGARRRSQGFGFVTMATQQESEDAIWDLNKQVWRGRKLRVQVA